MQCPQDGSELGEPRVCFLDLRERPASLGTGPGLVLAKRCTVILLSYMFLFLLYKCLFKGHHAGFN